MSKSAAAASVLIMDNGRDGGAGRDLAAHLRELGFTVEHRRTETRAEGQALLRDVLQRVGAVAVVGGDGTVNTAAEVLADTGVPLAVLPAGTANDFARNLSLPAEPAAVARMIRAGTMRSIDVGTCGERIFLNVAHVGWGALAGRMIAGREKGLLGAVSYAVGALRAWRANRPFRAELHCDAVYMRIRASHVSVANGRYFGGGVAVSDAARNDDGQLRVVCLRHRPLWRVFWLGLLVSLGRRPRGRDIVEAVGGRIDLETRRPLPVAADGEQIGHTPARFGLRPAALRVFVPEAPAPGA